MPKIRFDWDDEIGHIRDVFLDGEYIGQIKHRQKGWKHEYQFFPKHNQVGEEIFNSVLDCEDATKEKYENKA